MHWNSSPIQHCLEQQMAVLTALINIWWNVWGIDTSEGSDISDVEDMVRLRKPPKIATTMLVREKSATVLHYHCTHKAYDRA